MTMIKDNVEEIEEEIRLHGDVEWRSKKKLDEFVMSNTFDKNICIVGYITSKTMQKWGLYLHRETPTASKPDNYYVGVRNNNICYLWGLCIPKPVDYSYQRKLLCSMCGK